MNDQNAPLSVIPYIAGAFCILVFLLIGLSAPVLMEMYTDFGIDPLPFHLKVISMIYWWWTLPFGFVVALTLACGRFTWSIKTNRIAGLAIIILSIGILAIFAISIFRPIFKM
jgi:hypothetical protein